MISNEAAFAVWAPDEAPWSLWAKPVGFLQEGGLPGGAIPDAALPPVPLTLDSRSAVIVDLPGAEAVHTGLSLAQRGFQPVPLFNGTSGPMAVIDVSPISRALGGGVGRLMHRRIDSHAAPAFLLDSRRYTPAVRVAPGAYDNRWIALPQDFPSGALLLSRGIRTATVLRKGSLTFHPDLTHVLRRWQDHGVQINAIDVATGRSHTNVDVPRPSMFRKGWYAAIALLGFHRSNVGGFGSSIPDADATSGGFYG